MRLEQLKIDGYGILWDLQIEFEPGVTVIYGLNGTGKTTLMNFIRACLYGFQPRNSPQRYEPILGGLHGGHLRVAADGKRYLISRTQGQRSAGFLQIEDLETGNKIAESQIHTLTGGISQSVFETVFAFSLIDILKLELLKDQELNSLLYSVGLGLKVSLADVEHQLTKKMDEIYKPRGKIPSLNKILADMASIRERQRQSRQINQEYRQIIHRLEEKENTINDLRTQIRRLNKDLQQHKTMLEAFPHWQDLVTARQRLNDIPVQQLPRENIAQIESKIDQLKQIDKEYQEFISKLPNDIQLRAALVEVAISQENYEPLLSRISDFEALVRKEENQVAITSQRLEQLLFEIGQIENELISIEQQIVALIPDQIRHIGLPTRMQWVLRINEIDQNQKEEPDKGNGLKITLYIFSVLGWVVLFFQYLSNEEQLGIWLILIFLVTLLTSTFYFRRIFQTKKQKIQTELMTLYSKLNITEPDQIYNLQARFTEEEALLSCKDLLIEKQRHLSYTITALEKKLRIQQKEVEANREKHKTLMRELGLPETLDLAAVKAYLTELKWFSHLENRRQEIINELNRIYQLCNTRDIDEIRKLYKQQTTSQQLKQDIIYLETILATYLGRDLDRINHMMGMVTKEELDQQLVVIQRDLDLLQSQLDTAIDAQGSLIAKKGLLEEDQKLEEFQLELEFLKSKGKEELLQWASLKACHRIIGQVSRKYEKERQPQVLQIATEYFARITNNQYQRVYAPLGLDELKVEDNRGSILSVDQLSRGTIEQLYLSLRFALAKNVAQLKKPLPIVADDILVNFDHYRLKQTVELIKEISARQQIILLTCHGSTASMFPERNIRLLGETFN